MKWIIPFLLYLAAMIIVNQTIANAASTSRLNSTQASLQFEKLSGGPGVPITASIILTPSIAASLMYTDTQGSVTQIDFPANAVTQTTTIVMDIDQTNSFVPGYIWTGHLFYVLGIQNGSLNKEFNFSAPITITIEYSDSDIQKVPDEDRLKLYWWSGSNWIDSASTCTPATSYTRNPELNRISIPVCQSSSNGLFATYPVFLPVVSR